MKDKKKAKSGISKKEIRSKIQESVNRVIADFSIQSPSRKTRKAVKKISGRIAGRIKKDLKKLKNQKKKRTLVHKGLQKVKAS